MIGDGLALRKIRAQAERQSSGGFPVLITGETGTGKEILARHLHAVSPRGAGPFVALNCGTVQRDLVSDELFGHRKGAFSGALDARRGLVAAARGGTLFLDEVDSLPLEVQACLLRLLQEKEYRPLGEDAVRDADVRFIFATNADLRSRIGAGTFREDLFYRISVGRFHLPPLRERREDIPTLAAHFLEKFAALYGTGRIALADDAVEALEGHPWPGNIRELENVLHRAVFERAGEAIRAADLELPRCGAGRAPEEPDGRFHGLKHRVVEDFEKGFVEGLLHRHHGNVTVAAKGAGLDRRTFQRLMSKHGVGR